MINQDQQKRLEAQQSSGARTVRPQQGQALKELADRHRVLACFLDLIKMDTQADESVKAAPSSVGQLQLGAEIMQQLRQQAAALKQEIKLWRTADGVVCLQLPATSGCESAAHLALLAHLDTAPDCSGAGVRAQLVKDYPGGPILLQSGLILDEAICPELYDHVGDDIIVTDGTTVLGADDKAGCAVLMELVQRALEGQFAHGPLSFVFTVDEEIGRSADLVPLVDLGADFGVTIDGCEAGELDVATFNASACEVTVKGLSIHTGSACGRLINAIKLAADFVSQLPADEAPETTQGREGFYHVCRLSGGVEQAVISLILRDFEQEGLAEREDFIRSLCERLNAKYAAKAAGSADGAGAERFVPEFHAQYRNLSAVLQAHPAVLELCRQAYASAGVPVREHYVRGGTDGSNLSYKGLPCPNIFTGALNCHGPYECLPVGSLLKSLQCTQALIELTARAPRTAVLLGSDAAALDWVAGEH